jgi:hypothetical protein
MPSSPEAVALTEVSHARARAVGALLEGWRRVFQAPAITAGVWLLTLAVAAPLAVVLGGQIETHLGSSLEAERMLGSWSTRWEGEFNAGAQGVAETFTHEILGFGGTLATWGRFADAIAIPPSLVGAVVLYLAAWMFLSGGVMDRIARGRPVRISAFFAACGVYFFRFARIGVVIGALYWALFRWLHPLLFGTIYDTLTRNTATEHQAIVFRTALYVVFFACLIGVNTIADFAKVRAVVEDRRSALATLGASIRFVRRRPLRILGLYLLNVLVFLVIARLWLQIAPTASTSTWSALLAAQLFLLARVWAKLAFMASEIVFFQGELAHATYTAAPEPTWPDSPAIEAIRNLRG